MKIKKCFLPFLVILTVLISPKYSLSEEKIEVVPLIQTSKGLSGESFNYLEGEPELRLLRVKIPVGLKTPIHKHPSPMLIHVTRGKLKHLEDRFINAFRVGDVFVVSNNVGEQYVQNI